MKKDKLLQLTQQFVRNKELSGDDELNAAFILKEQHYEDEKRQLFKKFDQLRAKFGNKIIDLYKTDSQSSFGVRMQSFMKAALSDESDVFNKEEKKELNKSMLDDEVIRAFLKGKNT